MEALSGDADTELLAFVPAAPKGRPFASVWETKRSLSRRCHTRSAIGLEARIYRWPSDAWCFRLRYSPAEGRVPDERAASGRDGRCNGHHANRCSIWKTFSSG